MAWITNLKSFFFFSIQPWWLGDISLGLNNEQLIHYSGDGPFNNQTMFNHLNTRLVHYSDPHCQKLSTATFQPINSMTCLSRNTEVKFTKGKTLLPKSLTEIFPIKNNCSGREKCASWAWWILALYFKQSLFLPTVSSKAVQLRWRTHLIFSC